jgi:hypothetical protein
MENCCRFETLEIEDACMGKGRVIQIPVPGNSGITPTGAIQFQDDWPGLFIRGDDALMVLCAIEKLAERLVGSDDVVIASAMGVLAKYVEIIEQDVIVRPGA